ncbi:MAG: hypothetical protein ABI837_01590 [Acidobacteriota bacterium]
MTLIDLLAAVDELDELDDRSFNDWQFQLVQRYRRNEPEQELIAVTVGRRYAESRDETTRERLDELQAMLDSAHDPMI